MNVLLSDNLYSVEKVLQLTDAGTLKSFCCKNIMKLSVIKKLLMQLNSFARYG
jgi:hypothetical protein